MRLIFMGSPEFAVPSLRAARDGGHDVAAVVSQPPRRRGRKMALLPTPVAAAAEQLGIPVHTPEKPNAPEFVEQLDAYQADVILVIAYGEMLGKAIRNLCPHGCVNAHASLLPRHRGAAPITAAIREGDSESGVTLIRLVRKLDAGPMLMRRAIPLAPDETAGSLHDRLASLSADCLAAYLDGLQKGETFEEEQQDDSQATYAPQLTKDEGHIDWAKPAEVIERHIRAMHPWPGAYATLADERALKILAAKVDPESTSDAAPGTVITVDGNDGVIVATGDRPLHLLQLQLPGKKALNGPAFARGRGLQAGDMLS